MKKKHAPPPAAKNSLGTVKLASGFMMLSVLSGELSFGVLSVLLATHFLWDKQVAPRRGYPISKHYKR